MNTIKNLRNLAAFTFIAACAVAPAQFVPTAGATGHLEVAETMAFGLYNQGIQGELGADVNGTYVSFNRYGASYSDLIFESGQFAQNEDGDLIQTTPYRNYSVCANFVTRTLEEAYNWDWQDYTLADGTTSNSPSAAEYSWLINNNKGLSKVSDIADVTAGDLIAIDYTSTPNAAGNVGHVMIVRGLDHVRLTKTNSKSSNKYKIWAFRIVDSTNSPHDSVADRSDSRVFTTPDGTAVITKGAGVGMFYVITNLDGTLRGYLWNFNTTEMSASIDAILAGDQSQTKRPMVFGRVTL